jgi:DNA mismatch repair protein MutS
MGKSAVELTPMMEQYFKIKAKHNDKILLYRMGDFYETFLDDARTISRILGITLTKRANGKAAEVPLAGFPYHALDNYLPKLVQAGHRVAICEQVEDPKAAKGVVKREVVEVVSPGAVLNAKVLDQKRNNFLAALFYNRQRYGLAVADVSTGDFHTAEFPAAKLDAYIRLFNPRELLFAKGQENDVRDKLFHTDIAALTPQDDWIYTYDFALETLTGHFQQYSLKSFGLENHELAILAASGVIYYLKENYFSNLSHFDRINFINDGSFMLLDDATRRNLEINTTIMGQGKEGSLVHLLDHTCTPMGARFLVSALNQPLVDIEKITARQEVVQALSDYEIMLKDLRELLQQVGDLERWLARLVAGRANPRELMGLKQAFEAIPQIHTLLDPLPKNALKNLIQDFAGSSQIAEIIGTTLTDNPPLTLQEGNVIKAGYSEPLDELRQIARTGKEWLNNYVAGEKSRTGIGSLKIGYNKVFGYYIDVTKTHLDKVPEDYFRKQTLMNSERFITPELKEYEDKITGAEDKIIALEQQLYTDLRERLLAHTKRIAGTASQLAELDMLANFAHIAIANNYARPMLHSGDELFIINGRHPVVEAALPPGTDFIANDVQLSCSDNQLMLITGPNMAGKSTYLRQTGLIVLLAQIGSFVPADECRLGIVDRIFTRVGASDNLASGESTFMVEMNETAYILNHATPKSLILLDEIGRGTSTTDGLSIAWSVAEYLHQNSDIAAKTMFATHYHELTELAELYPRIKNYNIAVREVDDHIVFLRKIVPGGTDNSYGIHVGEMAGLPKEIIRRARQLLDAFADESGLINTQKKKKIVHSENQLSIFQPAEISQQRDALRDKLRAADLDQMTPIEALNFLHDLKKMLQ